MTCGLCLQKSILGEVGGVGEGGVLYGLTGEEGRSYWCRLHAVNSAVILSFTEPSYMARNLKQTS
jgi:hypothetical protein